MDRKKYELRLVRRDGQRVRRHQPSPVIETFDVNRELDEVVGKHLVVMAAAAEGIKVPRPHQRVSEFAEWLPRYQIEVWRTDGYYREPLVVSTSTKGWRQY